MAKKTNDNMNKTDACNDEMPEISVDDLIDKLAEIQEQAETEKAKAEEMRDAALRLQAEFDNYRKRTNETNKRVREDGQLDVLTGLLPVMDVVGQAKSMISDANVLKGIDMIESQILALLGTYGVQRLDTDGAPFDPRFHEAILQVDAADGETADIITQTVQAGYVKDDRVVRTAKVVVSK